MPASGRVESVGATDESTRADHIHARACSEQAGRRERIPVAHRAGVATNCPCAVDSQVLAAEFSESRRFIAWSDAGLADHDRDGHPVVIWIEAGTGDDAAEVGKGEFVSHLRMVPRSAKWRHRLPSCSNRVLTYAKSVLRLRRESAHLMLCWRCRLLRCRQGSNKGFARAEAAGVVPHSR